MSLTVGFCSILSQHSQSVKGTEVVPERLGKFSLTKPLPMRLQSYVEHFLYQLDLDEKILPATFLVIEPLLQYLTLYNIHKLVFTALAIAYKCDTDKHVKNLTLEKIGVLRVGELAELEKTLLKEIDWNLQYSRYMEIERKLKDEGVESEDEKMSNDEQETNFTECGDNDSFSELNAFFLAV